MALDPVSWLILGLSLLVVAFAGIIELAFTTVNRSEVRKMSEEGVNSAGIIERLLHDPWRFLLTAMLMKTVGLIMAGGAVLRILPSDTPLTRVLLVLMVTWLLASVVQVVGRSYALPRSQWIALRAAPLLQIVTLLLWPASALLHRIGSQPGKEKQEEANDNVFLSEDGLRLLIDVGDEEDVILDSEKQMIASILEMDETVAREVMVPRIDLVTISVDTSLHEALGIIIAAGHSRIPVYEGNIDHVVGFLYAKDLLQCFYDNQIDRPIETLLRPAHFVPVSKKVNTLLREMQKHRVHVAMVVDEYGGTAGLVTIEDIIEEIVGEIQDEYDAEEESYVESIGPSTFLINSRFDVYSLSKLLDVDLPDQDADTLGGMIYSLLGHVPEQGESVEVAGWRFTVLSLEGRRIDEVRAELITDPSAHDGKAADANHAALSKDSALKSFVSE